MTTRWDDDARPEEAWHNRTIDELADLREQIIAADCTEAFANSLIGWLVSADSASMSKSTRADYRKVLREIDPPVPPGRRRRTRARQSGHADLRLLAGAAAGGSVLAIAAQTGPVGALAALVPIILETSTETPETAVQRPVSLADRRERRDVGLRAPELVLAVGF